MPALTDPNLGMKYGYDLGEHGWGTDVSNNFKKLGALLHLSVLDNEIATPPVSPTAGDRYIVGQEASGDWLGHEDDVAVYVGSAWEFYTPAIGWYAYLESTGERLVFNGTAWISSAGVQPYDLHVTYNGRMDNGVTLLRAILPRTTTFNSGLTESFAKSEVAAAAEAVCTIYKNGASVGTITWAAAATTGAFAMATTQGFSAGDILEIVAPTLSDATLADISITLVGWR